MLRTHVSLSAADLEASVRFYSAILSAVAGQDVRPVKRRPGYAKFLLDPPGLNLSLVETRGRSGADPGPAHFGIEVAEPAAVEAAIRRLGDSGLPLDVERNRDCCYALQDKVWVSDPDGRRWEFFTVRADTDSMDGLPDAGAEDAAGACCVEPPVRIVA